MAFTVDGRAVLRHLVEPLEGGACHSFWDHASAIAAPAGHRVLPYWRHCMPYEFSIPAYGQIRSTGMIVGIALAYHVDWDDTRYASAGQYYHVSGFVRPWLPVTLNTTPEEIGLGRWKLIPFYFAPESVVHIGAE